MLEGNVIISLYEKLSMIDDPRDSRGKKYDLSYILILIIIGFLMGKNDFVNIEHVLKYRVRQVSSPDRRNGQCIALWTMRVFAEIGNWRLKNISSYDFSN